MVTRRRTMGEQSEWATLIHNFYSGYRIYKGSNNYTVEIRDNGAWAEFISNGTNTNNSGFILNPMFVYNDYKDKLCRLTWNIECSDPTAFTTDTGTGNISLNTASKLNPTYAGDGRKGKVDYAALAEGNFLGYHQETFVPSELFASVTKSTYFGWNIGFRSSVNGLALRILELTFEVHK